MPPHARGRRCVQCPFAAAAAAKGKWHALALTPGLVHAASQACLPNIVIAPQEHAEGSVQCAGKDCAMLFGSTGAGKSTLLHLLAGATFSRETVKVGSDDDVFGAAYNMQLVTEMKIPGCEIGNSSSSTTMLLNSHFDPNTSLTYVDTPGFNNVGDGNDDDTTIDAANSAAIMRTIRSCKSLRIVFLISVKDELNNTKGGQIKKLFEVMNKLIKAHIRTKVRFQCLFSILTECMGTDL